MAKTHVDRTFGASSPGPIVESEDVLEEVIDASLHPDRAHHDEIGRTEEPSEHTPPSPREQPAEPIDIKKVDE